AIFPRKVDFSCFGYHPDLESRLTFQEKWVLVRLLVGLGLRFAQHDFTQNGQAGRDHDIETLAVIVRPSGADPRPCRISAVTGHSEGIVRGLSTFRHEVSFSKRGMFIMTDNPRQGSARDDFFRASALQLLTALIADVCLSGHTEKKDQHLRQVRANLSEPEPKLRQRLQTIYDNSESGFVKENVAPFIAMTPETFSGVYANAVKETHWLSYGNYAALVSGSSFTTAELAEGRTDVFINLDLKTLENHAGLARVIIGSLLNAIYNRNGEVTGRTLFLLDEVARLGYLRILETARDAGRKYGITLLMLYQSIGQMREAYGGRDATSKWFESASWISFSAINDPETADYISKRCGDTTVEVDQLSRSSQTSGSSRTRSKQLARRPLMLPHDVLRMRTDEQVIFIAGNPPLRCGRAIWFRRTDMRACVGENRFYRRDAGRRR
ncbi:type IV secretory system conjugative DNA transfer family protein, partial [Bradyrhizobium ottawaense]